MTRRYFVPDVPQTSSLESGLAALKCVLDGYNIPISQRRLQELLQPAVQATTLEKLEQAAKQFGLDTEQRMTPIDHFLISDENVPAIVVARQSSNHPTASAQPSFDFAQDRPNNATTQSRFLVVWRRHGDLFQVMDPAIGERWLTEQRLLDELEIQTRPMSAQEWRDGAAAGGLGDLLRQRLLRLKLAEPEATRLAATALEDPHWRSLAALDAATRAVEVGVRAGGFESGEPAGKLIAQLVDQTASG